MLIPKSANGGSLLDQQRTQPSIEQFHKSLDNRISDLVNTIDKMSLPRDVLKLRSVTAEPDWLDLVSGCNSSCTPQRLERVLVALPLSTATSGGGKIIGNAI